jgi:hypothetical protein
MESRGGGNCCRSRALIIFLTSATVNIWSGSSRDLFVLCGDAVAVGRRHIFTAEDAEIEESTASRAPSIFDR